MERSRWSKQYHAWTYGHTWSKHDHIQKYGRIWSKHNHIWLKRKQVYLGVVGQLELGNGFYCNGQINRRTKFTLDVETLNSQKSRSNTIYQKGKIGLDFLVLMEMRGDIHLFLAITTNVNVPGCDQTFLCWFWDEWTRLFNR